MLKEGASFHYILELLKNFLRLLKYPPTIRVHWILYHFYQI